MQLLSDRSNFLNYHAILLSFLLSFGIGLVIIVSPIFALTILGIFITIFALVLFRIPVYICVGAAVLAATLSRLAVASGFIPSMINFLHFPLAISAFFIAISQKTEKKSLLASSIEKGLYGILFISFLSWVANGGEIARPFFTWLVFCEPFLLIYALLKAPPSAKAIRWLWKIVFGVIFLQLPLGIWQALTIGLSDNVQGTFIRMGAGHHVAGAVTIIGVFLCISKGVKEGPRFRIYLWLACILVLLIFPVLSDAKQVFIAFLPALIFMIARLTRVQFSRLMLAIALLSIAIYTAFYFYPPLQMVGDLSIVLGIVKAKIEAVGIVGAKISDTLFGWFWGLGPGNSVSRVALLSVGGYVMKSSPIYLLGLRLAPVTQDILFIWMSKQLFVSSSVWSGMSSWLGLFGDFGIIGLGFYLWIVWKLWKGLSQAGGQEAIAAKASLIMSGILGFVFSWLEEPGFTLLVALMVGLALVSKRKTENAHTANP